MWHIYTIKYYSNTKRNKIGSFVTTWMNLESVIQSKVSQKNILMCIYTELEKFSTGEPICRAVIEMQTWRTDLWTQ